MQNIQKRISQDLHDDIGSALSGIALYSYITKQQIKNNETGKLNQSLEIIQNTANGMVTRLSDIVWAINPINDNLSELIQRLEDYGVEMATVKNITFSVSCKKDFCDIKLPMDHCKNIFLIFKEAINNSIKYSNCTTIILTATGYIDHLTISLTDNGIGFDPEKQKTGNGLQNIKQRAKEINGNYSICSSAKGTLLELNCLIPQ